MTLPSHLDLPLHLHRDHAHIDFVVIIFHNNLFDLMKNIVHSYEFTRGYPGYNTRGPPQCSFEGRGRSGGRGQRSRLPPYSGDKSNTVSTFVEYYDDSTLFVTRYEAFMSHVISSRLISSHLVSSH